MKLYKVNATYDRGRVTNIPMTIYIVAENETDAMNKTYNKFFHTPDKLNEFALIVDAYEVANDNNSLDHVLIL